MIRRDLHPVLLEQSRHYPVVTVTGPRQSGKTTLCRAAFPDHAYVSLEALDRRDQATQDPRGFLDEFRDGAIVDEVQHAPGLFSYLQEEVDADPRPGRFILTGSRNLALAEGVSQSLAGRTAILRLLPPSWPELQRFPDAPDDLFVVLWTGAFPRIHHRRIPPDRWLSDYITTYVERDLRQVRNVGDLGAFTTFLRLVAGRTACTVNLSALGGDAGVSHNTARSWLSVLEAGFVCHQLRPWFTNARKQLIKAPKLHMIDSGLTCQLLGIRSPEELRHHPLRGPIFESWVATELLKASHNAGRRPRLHHFRDARRLEVDIVVDGSTSLQLVEVKSGATVDPSSLNGPRRLADSLAAAGERRRVDSVVVFGGEQGQRRSGGRFLPWRSLHELVSDG